MRRIAETVLAHGAALTAARSEQVQAGAALAEELAGQVPLAEQLCAALDAAARHDTAVRRKRAGLRKSATALEAAQAARKAETAALDGFAEQLDALHLSAQLLATQGEDEGVRALSAGLGRLSGQFRAHRVQSSGKQDEMARSVAALQAALERLTGTLDADTTVMVSAAKTARAQLATLHDMAAMAHGLGDALKADEEKSQAAMEMMHDALLASEAFADLAAAFERDVEPASEPACLPDHDQTALAAHWHAG